MGEGRKSYRVKVAAALFVAVPLLFFAVKSCYFSGKSWNGVDEAVVEKIAKEHGRQAAAPLLDPGSGDLLLFLFLLAGAVGGFAAGYCWRDLVKKND
ncbi:cobalt ABC transporter permease [Geomonas sp. Red32]|uniref:cobalt ABC transporter permease n=1 Tax=Geomonas sp. Red32 TaxID=2912856 RepID=UPI00202CAAD8|nr:cobalt ABC transporter permease [Geomonas sp. Red32]MCM0081087.1 cobalt ABC transporter permease [Geomonas sp. Red32]